VLTEGKRQLIDVPQQHTNSSTADVKELKILESVLTVSSQRKMQNAALLV